MRNIEMSFFLRGVDLVCVLWDTPDSMLDVVINMVTEWVNRRSCGRQLRLLEKHVSRRELQLVYGSGLTVYPGKPDSARLTDEHRFFAGLGYYKLPVEYRKLADDKIRDVLVFVQVFSGKAWKKPLVILSVGGCERCLYNTQDGCMLGNMEADCSDWHLSKGADPDSQPYSSDQQSSDSDSAGAPQRVFPPLSLLDNNGLLGGSE